MMSAAIALMLLAWVGVVFWVWSASHDTKAEEVEIDR
jgi:hypothetical protein